MTLVSDIPPWTHPHLEVYAVRSSHNFIARQVRKKLILETDEDALIAEAFEMVRRDIGRFPSEDNPNEPFLDEDDEETERGMRSIAMHNFESLRETESYLWGLGISGVFHQWKRDTRGVITVLSKQPPSPEKLEKLEFKGVCKQVKETGFDIESHRAFSSLRITCLVANAIKHGSGKSFRELAVERPDLFPNNPLGELVGPVPLQARHLRVSAPQFDEAVEAIDELWARFEDVALQR